MGFQTHTPPQSPALPPPIPSPTALAPGFRFHPTDEELVSYYLKRKVSNRPVRFNAIAEVDIYKLEPWELADKSRLRTRDQEWYFFSVLDKKYGNGARMNRATGQGYWKATGKDREIRRDSQLIAMKKTLVFHSGRAPGGQRTNWVMHEYRLVDDESDKSAANQIDYVLCRVFHKNNIGPPNGNRYAPFMEEEWDDGKSVLVPGEDELDEAGNETRAVVNNVEQDTHSINKHPDISNGLPAEAQKALTPCKSEGDEDYRQVCVVNTQAPFPLLQYKRRRHNNDRGSSSDDASENSAKTTQNPSSSTITTAATKTTLTNAATATAVSALLEFSLMDSIELKETHPPAQPDPPTPPNPPTPPKFDASAYLGSAVPPSCMKLINDLQSEIHKISVEKETLRLEMMSAQAMINILQSRIDYLSQKNVELNRSSCETE